MSKGDKWRRGANAMARALWKSGRRYEAYMLLREVMRDANQ